MASDIAKDARMSVDQIKRDQSAEGITDDTPVHRLCAGVVMSINKRHDLLRKQESKAIIHGIFAVTIDRLDEHTDNRRNLAGKDQIVQDVCRRR